MRDDPPQQLKTIGTGPWELVQYVPGSFVKLKRYEGYQPNTSFEERSGFGGRKQACFDTVTFRIVTEPGARVAGLQTGGSESYPGVFQPYGGFADDIAIVDGYVRLPEAPGIGMELKRTMFAEMRKRLEFE